MSQIDATGVEEPAPLGPLSRLAVGLMFPALIIPVGGWFIAQGFTARIPHFDDWTGAWIHTLAVDTFALLLAVSMLINASVATMRRQNRPKSFMRFARLPLWVFILIALGCLWISELALSSGETNPIEEPTAIAIAIVSIGVCVYSSKGDAASKAAADARRVRRAARRESIPRKVRDLRQRRVLYPATMLVATAIAVGVSAWTFGEISPVRHVNCEVDGISEYGGEYARIDTTNCGSFDLGGGPRAYNEVSNKLGGSTFDIVSQGWTFDLPPEQQIIMIKKHEG